MSHYAKIENNQVVEVIVAEQDFVDTQPGQWVQTSYRTHSNQHPEGRPLRGNYAGIGYTYDPEADVFIPPQPFPSWRLNTSTWSWEAPKPRPEGNTTIWDEQTLEWI
jgi:hypothetical protein